MRFTGILRDTRPIRRSPVPNLRSMHRGRLRENGENLDVSKSVVTLDMEDHTQFALDQSLFKLALWSISKLGLGPYNR